MCIRDRTYTEPYVGEHKYKASARQYQNMLTASGVTLLNKFDDKPIAVSYTHLMI